jgi:glycosyltransferase involved in cell wall biosynthesis
MLSVARFPNMPPITALLHTENDALRLGRALETLYPCDEILIVDHGSRDSTLRIAREYGARVVPFAPGTSLATHLLPTHWILCLTPRESVTEALAASLFEWKSLPTPTHALSLLLRDETAEGWTDISPPETRLVPASWRHWHGSLPLHDRTAPALEGELLRFAFP